MERKPQQHTLSIRISDTLRDFLEASKGVIANACNESASISDVARLLLESARDDRLDFIPPIESPAIALSAYIRPLC